MVVSSAVVLMGGILETAVEEEEGEAAGEEVNIMKYIGLSSSRVQLP